MEREGPEGCAGSRGFGGERLLDVRTRIAREIKTLARVVRKGMKGASSALSH